MANTITIGIEEYKTLLRTAIKAEVAAEIVRITADCEKQIAELEQAYKNKDEESDRWYSRYIEMEKQYNFAVKKIADLEMKLADLKSFYEPSNCNPDEGDIPFENPEDVKTEDVW